MLNNTYLEKLFRPLSLSGLARAGLLNEWRLPRIAQSNLDRSEAKQYSTFCSKRDKIEDVEKNYHKFFDLHVFRS